jgi:glutamine amidotransferase-like uncharacterized protein
MKKILVLLFIIHSVFALAQYDFAIYHDGNVGAWEDGIIAFEHFLDWKEITHNRVTAQNINTIVLKDFYKAIFFPGGDADYYNADINSIGIQHIQDLVSNNGAYIGMCAGAEFACDKLIWQDYEIDYPLDLFQGEAVGPIDQLAVWPDYAMATLSMNLNDEINQFEPENEDMLYWGGTIFIAYSGMDMDTIATYDGFFNNPAIIKFTYGNGRVLLISPHPEIEEDSNRDGVNVAEELEDNGSDWNFLWTATDWLLGEPLSNPNSLSIPYQSPKLNFTLYPNPAKDVLNLSVNNYENIKELTIYNYIGQEVLVLAPIESTIDLSGIQEGIYIVELVTNTERYRGKIIIHH